MLKKGKEYRINAELNLSRSFGDRSLKHCMSSKPDLYRFKRGEYVRWVLASDGFYLAAHSSDRMRATVLGELQTHKQLYADNASAIFIDV